MAQKNATPSLAQQDVMKKNGLKPHEWVVVRELGHSMIIRSRIDNSVKMINK